MFHSLAHTVVPLYSFLHHLAKSSCLRREKREPLLGLAIMGAKESKHQQQNSGRIPDFESLGTSISRCVEDIVQFLINTPRTIPTNKRKAIVLQIDTRLGVIDNLYQHLYELDQKYEDCVYVVYMFDRILSILWTVLESRYPDIVAADTQRTSKPQFLNQNPVHKRLGAALLNQITLTVEIIIQCASMIMTASEAELREIRNEESTSSINMVLNQITDIKKNAVMKSIESIVHTDAVYKHSVNSMIANLEKCAQKIKSIDLDELRNIQSMSHGFGPAPLATPLVSTPGSVTKSRSLNNIARRSSDASRFRVASPSKERGSSLRKMSEAKRIVTARSLSDIQERIETESEMTSTTDSMPKSPSAASLPVKLPQRFDPKTLQTEWNKKQEAVQERSNQSGEAADIVVDPDT